MMPAFVCVIVLCEWHLTLLIQAFFKFKFFAIKLLQCRDSSVQDNLGRAAHSFLKPVPEKGPF